MTVTWSSLLSLPWHSREQEVIAIAGLQTLQEAARVANLRTKVWARNSLPFLKPLLKIPIALPTTKTQLWVTVATLTDNIACSNNYRHPRSVMKCSASAQPVSSALTTLITFQFVPSNSKDFLRAKARIVRRTLADDQKRPMNVNKLWRMSAVSGMPSPSASWKSRSTPERCVCEHCSCLTDYIVLYESASSFLLVNLILTRLLNCKITPLGWESNLAQWAIIWLSSSRS